MASARRTIAARAQTQLRNLIGHLRDAASTEYARVVKWMPDEDLDYDRLDLVDTVGRTSGRVHRDRRGLSASLVKKGIRSSGAPKSQ